MVFLVRQLPEIAQDTTLTSYYDYYSESESLVKNFATHKAVAKELKVRHLFHFHPETKLVTVKVHYLL